MSGLLTACASDSSAGKGGTGKTLTTALQGGTPVSGGTLRVGTITGGASETLDPLYGLSIQDSLRALQLYDGLFTIGSSAGEVVPALATSAERNADGSVWTLHLRDGVVWHDGRTLDAADVIYSIRRWADPTSPLLAAVAGIDVAHLRRTGALTVQVPMKAPTADLPALLALPVLTGVVQAGATTKSLQAKPIGTGPFKYSSFQPGSRSEFVANKDYWQKNGPHFASVEINSSFSDENARVNALLSGAVDLVPQASYLIARQQMAAGKVHVFGAETSTLWNFPMRVDKGALADVRVRQALRMVADRQALIDGALGGFGTPGNDLLGAGVKYYATDLKRVQDIDQAKSLLKQAGHSDLRVTLQTSGVADGFTQAATLFAQQAKRAGITVKVDVVAPETYFTPAGGYLSAPFRTTFYSPAASLEGSYRSFLTPGGQNDSGWGLQSGGAGILSNLRRACAETDSARAQERWAAIQKQQFDEGGLLGYANASVVNLAGDKLRGLREGPVGFVNNGRLRDGWFAAN
ncbi:ABC transporter substrate-binding protein [Streptomyces sp. STR69]|uniref:ABC transporter substrate-binding protein n=1 Tax=Streptomyces sp. STR69 TaxID=1796942 RepID=UPI0021C978E5|nr:ABC transporter substrate-binding protein [Streptomyces sp. STR69]